MIERRAEASSSYARLRRFLETEELATRRLTAEWLAGRLVLPLRECAQLLDTRVVRMPVRVYRALAKAVWRLRLGEAPPGGIDFELYPWILSNEKVKKTLDWTPRYSSRETFLIAMRAQGRLPAEDAPAAVPEPSEPELYSASSQGR